MSNTKSKQPASFDGILHGLDEVRSDVNSVLHLLQLLNDLEAVHEFLELDSELYGDVAGIQTHTLSHECENLLGALDMLERISSDVREMDKAWAIACEELDAHESATVEELGF